MLIESLPWQEYVEKYEPKYTLNLTVQERLLILYEILEFISNFLAQIPPPSFTLDLNALSADSKEEYRQLLGYRYSNETTQLKRFTFPSSGNNNDDDNRRHLQQQEITSLDDLIAATPPAKDWHQEGALTPIKDQGRCGSCWALTTTAGVEAATYIHTGFLQSLSYQQLVSCDTSNSGCDGGSAATAMIYVWQTPFGGLATDMDYPYTDSNGVTTTTCLENQLNATVAIDDPRLVVSYSDTYSYEERVAILKYAVSREPVSIALKSECPIFQNYDAGIMTEDYDCACNEISCIDHAVLLVGYNDTHVPPYWKIRNSWSKDFGEDGYMRIAQKQGSGDWGLFGMLGEGVLALEAFNYTGQQVDESTSQEDSFAWWKILVIVIAALIVICCGAVLIFNCFSRCSK